MIKTDIIIIGAGPVGLFTIFEAGLMKLRCHVIDSISTIGGQLNEIYPKKPIYDIPGYPIILAGDLIDNLKKQASPFKPGFTLGERAEKITKSSDGNFIVETNKGKKHQSKVVIIPGGLGSFEPRKPLLENLSKYEGEGIQYSINEPNLFFKKKVFISGGGDSALDWAIYLAENSSQKICLIHRSEIFRAHKDSVSKVYELAEKGKIDLKTNSEIISLHGNKKLKEVSIKNKNNIIRKEKLDFWLPLFGFSPKLGPINDWGLEIEKNSILVDNTMDYQTNIKGIFAVGDINTYPGKLKLILCGFHEATLAVQSAYKIINPNLKYTLKYTTVQGIKGFN